MATQRVGGLGHLGVRYANRLGHRVMAIARGPEKAALVDQLGADEYTDGTSGNPGEALRKPGGAHAIVATAAGGSSMSPLVAGPAPRGRMIVVGGRGPIRSPSARGISPSAPGRSPEA